MASNKSIEVEGADELRTSLARAVGRISRPRDLMQALADALKGNIERRFDSKRDPSGNKWDELRAATVERYRREDTDAKTGTYRRRGTILERTGRMRGSVAAVGGDTWAQVGMDRLTDGGRWAIPLLHETGTKRMARRGIFLADWQSGRLGAEDERDLEDEIVAFLDDLFGPG